MDSTQEFHDTLYMKIGSCCAGCDWWRSFNSRVGECTASPPVSGHERYGMIGISSISVPVAAGHVFTLNDHRCGAFKDDFDWASLPLAYLKRIGYLAKQRR